ncbi:MAG: hypothetical protein SVU69_09920 [Pseudomonadota bacterium]|nr:hypothetical protein [Pseudomonadota bacterium]
MIKRSIAWIWGALLPLMLSGSAWGIAPYGSMDDGEFEQFMGALSADPSLMAKERDYSFRLSTQQWDDMVSGLGLTHFTWVYAVTLKGEELPQLVGGPISDYSVMAVRAGRLIPIPFQIDERDTDGWVYEQGISGDVDGTAGVFDAVDEFVFMYRDTGGERFDPETMAVPEGRIVDELELSFDGTTRYAYVVKGSSLRDTTDYVNYDTDRLIADTTFYNFRNNPDNLLIFEDFRANAGPTPEHRVLDTLVLELSTGVITRWPRVEVGLPNLQAELVGVKRGPVRDVLKLKIWVVVAGIPVFRIVTDMTLYDQGIFLPVKLHIPGGEILTRVLNRPIIDIYLDMNDLRGGRFVAAVNPSGHYHDVDAQETPAEEQQDIHIPDRTWLWLESGRGWDVVLKFDVPRDWPVEGIGMYEDSVAPENSYEYEDFPEALPRFGFRVTKLPVGKLDIDITAVLWFPATVGGAGPEGFVQAMDDPPRFDSVTSSALARAD